MKDSLRYQLRVYIEYNLNYYINPEERRLTVSEFRNTSLHNNLIF